MSIPNVQHSDKYSVTISNIPGYIPTSNNKDNMGIYDLYVKSVTFPGHSLDLVEVGHMGYHINHAVSKKNENLDDLTITFKLSEGMKNWFYIYTWIKSMREGENINHEKWQRLNVIKEILVSFLDNERRPQYVYKFVNCFVTNVGSLSLTNGQDEELTFDITIKYEDFGLIDGECND